MTKKERMNFYWDEKSWGQQPLPKNVSEIIAEANRKIVDYIVTYGIDDEDEIKAYSEKLWSVYCEYGYIGLIQK